MKGPPRSSATRSTVGVVAWTGLDADYYDVHLIDYPDYLSAAEDAYRLNASGLRTDVVALGTAAANLH